MPPIVHGDYKMIPSLWYKMSTPTYQLLTIKSQILISASIVTHYPKIQNHQTFYQPFFIKNQYFWKTSHKKMFLFSFLIIEFMYSLFLFSKVCIPNNNMINGKCFFLYKLLTKQSRILVSLSVSMITLVPILYSTAIFGKLVRRKCFCFHF